MSNYNKLDNTNTRDPFADGVNNSDYDEDIIIQPDTNIPTKMHDININPSTSKLNSISPTVANPIETSNIISSTQFKKNYEGGIFSLNYYRQYFDINTSDFFENCKSSMNPVSKPSADEFNQVGDLYGSIWITASLVFLLFFCNSFASLLSGWILGTQPFNINYFKMIVSSINLLYGYTLLIPVLLYLILKFYFKVLFLIPLTKLIAIYSYANLLWSPAVFLSIFRGLLIHHSTLDTVLKWCCIIIGALMSGCSIVYKINVYFTTIFGEDDKKNMYILLSLLVLAHIGFAIGVKISFFGRL